MKQAAGLHKTAFQALTCHHPFFPSFHRCLLTMLTSSPTPCCFSAFLEKHDAMAVGLLAKHGTCQSHAPPTRPKPGAMEEEPFTPLDYFPPSGAGSPPAVRVLACQPRGLRLLWRSAALSSGDAADLWLLLGCLGGMKRSAFCARWSPSAVLSLPVAKVTVAGSWAVTGQLSRHSSGTDKIKHRFFKRPVEE